MSFFSALGNSSNLPIKKPLSRRSHGGLRVCAPRTDAASHSKIIPSKPLNGYLLVTQSPILNDPNCNLNMKNFFAHFGSVPYCGQ